MVLIESPTPVEQHGCACLEGAQLVAIKGEEPREGRRRQLADLPEEGAPVREAREEPLEPAEGAPVGERQRRVQPRTGRVDALGDEGGIGTLVSWKSQREAPRVRALARRELPACAQHRVHLSRIE